MGPPEKASCEDARVRLISYNVNSLKARLPRVLALLEEYEPDIVCLQETKASPSGFPHLELQAAGYVAADHSGGRWEGVAILARTDADVSDIVTGLPGEPDPDQARWIEASVDGVRVASVYVPNGREIGSETFLAKLAFFEAMAERASELADRPALFSGDMNVCPSDLDVWDVDLIHAGTHITEDERSRYRAILDAGYVDSFRVVEPDEPGFTWWDYRAGHFHKNFGLRIDLALVSRPLAERLTAAFVARDYRKVSKVREAKASDHAPLVVDFD